MQVDEAMTKQKQIVFTGHSSGASAAILAALWALDEYIFSHATRRENWSRYFIHLS